MRPRTRVLVMSGWVAPGTKVAIADWGVTATGLGGLMAAAMRWSLAMTGTVMKATATAGTATTITATTITAPIGTITAATTITAMAAGNQCRPNATMFEPAAIAI